MTGVAGSAVLSGVPTPGYPIDIGVVASSILMFVVIPALLVATPPLGWRHRREVGVSAVVVVFVGLAIVGLLEL